MVRRSSDVLATEIRRYSAQYSEGGSTWREIYETRSSPMDEVHEGYHCIGEVIALLNHQEAMKQEPIEDRVQESYRVEQVCRMFYRSHGSLSPCRNNVRTND